MEKSFEESARKRRSYVAQARAAFEKQTQPYTRENDQTEQDQRTSSTLGIRIIIALFLFACFVYFDQEKMSFQGIDAGRVVRQIEWNPLPTEKLEDAFSEIRIISAQENKQK